MKNTVKGVKLDNKALETIKNEEKQIKEAVELLRACGVDTTLEKIKSIGVEVEKQFREFIKFESLELDGRLYTNDVGELYYSLESVTESLINEEVDYILKNYPNNLEVDYYNEEEEKITFDLLEYLGLESEGHDARIRCAYLHSIHNFGKSFEEDIRIVKENTYYKDSIYYEVTDMMLELLHFCGPGWYDASIYNCYIDLDKHINKFSTNLVVYNKDLCLTTGCGVLVNLYEAACDGYEDEVEELLEFIL